MAYLSMELDMTNKLINGMNGRTIIMLDYLIKKARENKNVIHLRYRDIEQDLALGHTTVGYNMRFFQKIGVIEKLDTGLYRVNPEKINILDFSSEF